MKSVSMILALSLSVLLVSAPASAAKKVVVVDCNEGLGGNAEKSPEKAKSDVDPDVLKRFAAYFKEHMGLPKSANLETILGLPNGALKKIYGGKRGLLALAYQEHPESFDSVKKKALKAYIDVLKLTRRIPRPEEVAKELGIKLDVLDNLFGEYRLFENFDQLKKEAHEQKPEAFKWVLDNELHNEARRDLMIEAIKTRKRLIFTTAGAGMYSNPWFLESMKTYMKEMDAELFIIPGNMQTEGIDEVLINTPGVHVITNAVQLTPWMNVNEIEIIMKQINPLQGLENFAGILGSPQQRAKVIATIDNDTDYKRVQYTTGAITDPDYNGKQVIQRRTDKIAIKNHRMGGIVLEKDGRTDDFVHVENAAGTFHVRNIEFMPEKGGFMEKNKFYTGTGSYEIRAEAIVLGDMHVGYSDQKLVATIIDLVKKYKPKYLALHDLFDGHSVSHHEMDRPLTLAERAKKGELNLEYELGQVVAFINTMHAIDPDLKIIVVPSNHNAWLGRWLDSNRTLKDAQNIDLAIELSYAKRILNRDPLKYALLERDRTVLQYPHVERDRQNKSVNDPDRVIFQPYGKSFKVGPGVVVLPNGQRVLREHEIGYHGDLGPNGSKGSIKNMRAATQSGRISFGHTHTFAQDNGATNVGNSTGMMPYAEGGPSNWSQTINIVGPNAEGQYHHFVNGRWFTPDDEPAPDAAQFFFTGFPNVIPNNEGTSEQIDQYGTKH